MRHKSPKRYPRVARVNQVLREVVADEIERIGDERFGITTVTAVEVDPDLRRAVVWLSSEPDEDAATALAEHRVRLQAAIGRQLRLKRTPGLDFRADPAVLTGERIDAILREINRDEHGGEEDEEA
jgi:ribosome-binding factor A